MKTVLLAFCLAVACASNAFAQAAATATLRVTVVDSSHAIIVGATITVTGAEPATRTQSVPVATTADTGIATLTGLAPGRYTIQAAFPGFDTRTLQEVRIRSGENKQVAVLSIAKLEASVTVEQDKQQAAADPRGRSFGTVLTREEIEALERQHAEKPEGRAAHKALAKAATDLVHGPGATAEAIRASEILFGGGLDGISEGTFNEIVGEVPTKEMENAGLD